MLNGCSATLLSRGLHLVVAGSRFTTPTESRYAPIEGEALAVVYGLEKYRMFVLGCPNLIIVTDHKPLVSILDQRNLDGIKNSRLLNLKENTLMYRFSIKHVPGAKNVGPDACSRSPVKSMVSSLCDGIRQTVSLTDTSACTSRDKIIHLSPCHFNTLWLQF